MNFQIGHCSTKDIPVAARYYTPEELAPPKNMLVWCYSRWGCSRKDIFNPRFDSHWSPLIPKPKKGIK
jgi:hypothetical protein